MSGLEPLLFGTAATTAAPATSGLFGVAGAFNVGQSALTLGTVLGTAGAVQAGIAQKNAADFNAAMARRQADRERLIAEREADQFARSQSAILANARALRGASGTSGEGTALLVGNTLFRDALLGEETIRRGGDAKASSLEAKARLSQARGSAARTAGFFKAGSTLLTAESKGFG